MNENHCRGGGDSRQAVSHTCRAGRASGNYMHRWIRPLVSHFVADVIDRYNHDYAIAVRQGDIDRMVKNTAISNDFVLLHRPKTTTRATGHDNCPDLPRGSIRLSCRLSVGHTG